MGEKMSTPAYLQDFHSVSDLERKVAENLGDLVVVSIEENYSILPHPRPDEPKDYSHRTVIRVGLLNGSSIAYEKVEPVLDVSGARVLLPTDGYLEATVHNDVGSWPRIFDTVEFDVTKGALPLQLFDLFKPGRPSLDTAYTEIWSVAKVKVGVEAHTALRTMLNMESYHAALGMLGSEAPVQKTG